MKKIMKVFTSLLLALLVNLAISPSLVVLADEQYNLNSSYEVVQNSDYSVTLIDKVKGESVTIDVVDNHNAIYTDNSGIRNKVYIDDIGNVYLNGILKVSRDDFNSRVVKEDTPVSDGPVRMMRSAANLKYTYLDTLYYDTKTQGDIQGLALSLLSFVPYVGPVFAIAGIINTFKSLGHPTMYVKINRYYAGGNQFYRYDSFFYSDPGRTNLVTKRTEYKQMW
ncbi:hypothetical protein [Streptococcus sp. 20-1249]|uniref:hypothetical protein n=1 Tax=Streptococcus hepaticus TaxID=3349163 RepID=UPI0037495524